MCGLLSGCVPVGTCIVSSPRCYSYCVFVTVVKSSTSAQFYLMVIVDITSSLCVIINCLWYISNLLCRKHAYDTWKSTAVFKQEIINILNLALINKWFQAIIQESRNDTKLLFDLFFLQLVIRIFCKLALHYTDTVDATWNISVYMWF
jgi:hypothetical protein